MESGGKEAETRETKRKGEEQKWHCIRKPG